MLHLQTFAASAKKGVVKISGVAMFRVESVWSRKRELHACSKNTALFDSA